MTTKRCAWLGMGRSTHSRRCSDGAGTPCHTVPVQFRHMEYINGSLRLSPSDVIRFLDGNFAAWMDRLHAEPGGAGACRPDTPSEEDKLIQSYGDRHEKAHLSALKQQGPVTEIDRKAPDAKEQTLAAMRRGDPVIYQAALEADPFRGFADFLHRVDGPSRLGDWHYEPWDTKLARKVKPYFIVQLCAYAEMLEAVQGLRPSRAGAILGNGDVSIISIPQYWYAWRHLRQAFLDFQAELRPERHARSRARAQSRRVVGIRGEAPARA